MTYEFTGVPGINVNPQDIDGRVVVIAGVPGSLKKVWDSDWVHRSTREYRDVGDRNDCIPGLPLLPSDRDSNEYVRAIKTPERSPGHAWSIGPLTEREDVWLAGPSNDPSSGLPAAGKKRNAGQGDADSQTPANNAHGSKHSKLCVYRLG
jgi:hypothetical protein